MNISKTAISAALLTFSLLPLSAQIRVSELLAANTKSSPDVVDFEDYPDWVELENTSASAVSLAGYFLSDSTGNPYKWQFPATASIAPHGFLRVWTDGYDAKPGDVRPRGYWPWRNFTVEAYHTNFSLSSDGESVVLTKGTNPTSATLIQAASPGPAAVWKYLDNGSDQSTQWMARNFDDSAWASGSGKLGYGDSGNATTVSYGSSGTNKHITTYFRHSFQVVDPAAFQSLTLRLLVDDGAVVYLNGTEIVRRNLPVGTITFATRALAAVSGSDETTYYNYSVPANLLTVGQNVIAVEVHQDQPTSSDLGFDLSLAGSGYSNVSTEDSVAFGTQVDDISYGRDPSAPANWVYFEKPTPGTVNSGNQIADIRTFGSKTTISLETGFYSSPQTATLASASGTIHYTFDSTEPVASSPTYTVPLAISSPNKVLRARVIEPGKPMGPVETRSYLFGEPAHSVPVISIVADPNTLFGNQIGIYKNTHEPTSSNYGLNDVYKGKDAPATIEFIEPSGTLGFRANAGIRIGGENNWVHPQKALNVTIRGKYGSDPVNYDLFPGTGVGVYESFTLRDGGDNWTRAMLREGMAAIIESGRMQVDPAEYRPSIVFINGTYYGIHNIRTRWDDTWYAQRKGVDPTKVDHLIYGHLTSTATTLGADKGNTDDWLDLLAFLNSADLSDPANWALVEKRIDIDSYIDFVVMESYGNSTAWHHNREFWRERKAGAKWRWFTPDMDRTFYSSSLNAAVLNDLLGSEEILVRLKTNIGFTQRLGQRYAAHIASTLSAARINSIVSAMDTEIASEYPRHSARWPDAASLATRTAQIQEIKNFANQRPTGVYSEISGQLGLGSPVNLTLAISPGGGGKVAIDGVVVDAGVIKLFPNAAFDLRAEALPGYTFTGWTGVTGGESTTLTLTTAKTITANFSATGETAIGGTLPGNTILTAPNSPYALSSDIVVPPGVTLTVEAGVTLRMPARASILVQGSIQVNGSVAQPVSFINRGEEEWGGIAFESPDLPSTFSNVLIRGASHGPNPVADTAAISGINANLFMEFMDIDKCHNPISMTGGTTTLRDSTLRVSHTGDAFHVKRGQGEIRRCVLYGGTSPDTDAVDYDGVNGGIIADNRVYRFQGDNSDALDIGEGCSNLEITGNLIYYSTDKGLSVGQGSTVHAARNLIVGCDLAVGVKDAGSVATLDQNTFVGNRIGISAYEKNFGKGGGVAIAENCIFSKCGDSPILADARSSITVNWSLSDTIALPGATNVLTGPSFVDPPVLNFQLQAASPAINAGNPTHGTDPDGSRADIGALYQYSAGDYPFTIGETVVIEEILANSGSGAPDWIELHNRTGAAINIGGWFLSDSTSDLRKYQIAPGTVISANGYLVYYEDTNFGVASLDPGRVTPFALSDVGETVYLTSAVDGGLTDYQSHEDFGASLPGVSLGNYYKPSSDSYNFVPLKSPTPGSPNAAPLVGPIVISEIMYHPNGNKDSEWFELLNISSEAVTLFDADKAAGWRITDGIDYDFPSASPVTMAPGERIVMVKSLTQFAVGYSVPAGTQVIEWTSGSLSNSGETLQLARPAGVDANNIRQYARVDRVNYGTAAPWPATPDGAGPALVRIEEPGYGNDFANWTAGAATPGAASSGLNFTTWIASSGVPANQQGANDDPDDDGLPNLIEFAIGGDPAVASSNPAFVMNLQADQIVLSFGIRSDRSGFNVRIEGSATMEAGSWKAIDSSPISTSGSIQSRVAQIPIGGNHQRFFRMTVEK